MSGEPNFYRGNIPYGKGEIEIRIPRRNFAGALMPHYKPGAKNESAEITRAIQNPIGTKRLKEIAMGKKNAAIVVNDITRPTATYKLLPHLIAELTEAGIRDSEIVLIVATGTHRDNTREELEGMLGKDVLRRFKVVNHRNPGFSRSP